jgi:hypothetical protein
MSLPTRGWYAGAALVIPYGNRATSKRQAEGSRCQASLRQHDLASDASEAVQSEIIVADDPDRVYAPRSEWILAVELPVGGA